MGIAALQSDLRERPRFYAAMGVVLALTIAARLIGGLRTVSVIGVLLLGGMAGWGILPWSVRSLAAATYSDIVRRPLYYIVLLALAAMVFLSQYITLFSFYQEMNLVREMGMATITFFGFLLIVLLCGPIVTSELEDRTAVTLLSKPISRASFLLGKFFGLMGAVLPGVVVLAGVLFLTLWLMAMPTVLGNDAFFAALGKAHAGEGAIPVMRHAWSAQGGNSSAVWGEFRGTLEVIWRYFVLANGGVVFQGALLAIFQIAILAAFGISFAAFFPIVVSASATALLFILGNISSYMLAAVQRWEVGVLTAAGKVLYYLIPNLGYFNLQTFYSEGRIISARYLGYAATYALLYTVAVFVVSCSVFQRREIR